MHAHLCSYVITVSQACSELLWYELNILWLNIGNDIRFPNERIDWILINTINTLATLAETKSEDQWQSEPTRSKFA